LVYVILALSQIDVGFFWHPQKQMMFSFRTIHATKNADLLGERNNMFLGNTVSF
jgi:hypothetical protein